jgi:hypothetical protein
LIGGPIGLAAAFSALAWTHARLVIDLAAIFDHDPTDAARAADVLALLGVFPDALSAGKAVAELAGHVNVSNADAHAQPPFATATSAHLVIRLAGRLLPGASLVLDTLRSTAETERLADRAIRYFRTT